MSRIARFFNLFNKQFSTKTSRITAAALLITLVASLGAYLNLHLDITPPVSAEGEDATTQTGVLGANTQAAILSNTGTGGTGSQSTSAALETTETAGQVPGRVLLGFAASETLRPTYEEALSITGTVYERRQFKSGWYSATALNSMLNACDAHGQYCVVSFKVPGNNWNAVTSGQYNRDLDNLIATALARPKPFALAVHHEPQSDGIAAEWAAMQEYLVQYLAPVSSKLAFTTIGNGFWWGPNHGKGDAYVATYYPDSLISKMNQYHGIIAADFYDAEPDAAGNYKANADRASMKMQSFTDWARAKGVKAVGAGEFGSSSGAELSAAWQVMYNNSDIWVYGNYFNSLANSTFDWRLIPDSYPAYNSGVVLDLGGTFTSESRLNAFKSALAQSAVPR